jgi:hypothetical protein
MANFATHIAVGIITSGALATLTMASHLVSPAEIVTLAFAGATGSVLPDIDLGNSRPSHALFAGLGIFLAFAVLFNVAYKYSIAEMWLIWTATYLGVRYIGHAIFQKISHHRGIFHSLLAGLLFACIGAVFYYRALDASPVLSWLAGVFVFVGFLTHLVLDEIYSVDVFNERVKASFGTALKLTAFNEPFANIAMIAVLALAIWLGPPSGPFLKTFGSEQVWLGMRDQLLPADQNWFGVTSKLYDEIMSWRADRQS